MSDILQTREHVQLVRAAINTAKALDDAEKALREKTPLFQLCSSSITEKLGITLWHSVTSDTYFLEYNKSESIDYPTRVAALRALLNEEIEWKV